MKCFIERTLPVLEPFFIHKDGRTFHPLRHQPPKVVLMSVAGFPESSVFDQLSSWANFIFGGNSGHEKALVAEIYRPMAEALTIPLFEDIAGDILAATKKAGQELVSSLSVSAETMVKIKQPMASNPDDFLEFGNLFWKTCITEGVTPRELGAKSLVPQPDSTHSENQTIPEIG